MAVEGAFEPVELDDAMKAMLVDLIATIRPMIEIGAEQTADMAKWLLATLVAVNGGAILATLGRGPAPVPPLLAYAELCWLVGVILAIVSGMLSFLAGERVAREASAILARLIVAVGAGSLDFDLVAAGATLGNRGRPSLVVALASLLAFVAGTALAMAGMNFW